MPGELILVGGGGHCRSCIDVIEQEGRWAIAGILDVPGKVGDLVLGYPVIGSDADLETLIRGRKAFLLTIGQIKSSRVRADLYEKIKALGGELAVVLSPRAYVSPHAALGAGTIVLHGATVNAGARIGCNCIINSHALVEHDAVVESNCHISTGAVVNGGCRVEARTFVGSQAVLQEGIVIGAGSIIGAGMTVRRSRPPGSGPGPRKKPAAS